MDPSNTNTQTRRTKSLQALPVHDTAGAAISTASPSQNDTHLSPHRWSSDHSRARTHGDTVANDSNANIQPSSHQQSVNVSDVGHTRTRSGFQLAIAASMPQLHTPMATGRNLDPHHSPTEASSSRRRKKRLEDEHSSPHSLHHQRSLPRGTPSPTSPVGSNVSVLSRSSRRSSTRRAAAALAAAASAAEDLANQQNLMVISRRMSNYRVVHLLYQTDADLFDAIQEWKESHPTLWVDDAIDAFATAKGADALAQLVYSTEAFDIVLKYNAAPADLVPIFDQHSTPLRRPYPPESTAATYNADHRAIPEAAASSPMNAVSQGTAATHQSSKTSEHSTRLSQLRSSPGKLLGRALSLGSSRKRSDHPRHPPRPGSDIYPVQNAPHVSLAMSPSGANPIFDPVPLPPFHPLNPSDCSTDMFPSTIQAETAQCTLADSSGISSGSVYSSAVEQSQTEVSSHSRDPTQWPQAEGEYRKHKRIRPNKSRMREWKIQLHRRDFQLALLKEGVFIELEKSINSDAVYVKVLAPFWRLEDEAQKTNCKADLANSILPSIPYASRLFPRVTRLFPFLKQPGLEQRRESVLFKTARLTDFHLAEPGRKWSDVVRHAGAVRKDGSHVGSHSGSDGRPGFFQTSRRGYLVNSLMMRTESRNNPFARKMGLRSALRRGAYQKLFALHDGSFKTPGRSANDSNYRAQLRIKWSKRFWRSQPLDLVNAYYGERIGVYFAWLGHYTQWLTLPAMVGTGVFVFGVINAARLKKLDATPNALFAIFDNVLTMPFALFMSMWSTIYIEFWKRANQYYAFRWNMNDYERVELPRTEFRATRVRYSPVTGRKELYYPAYWKGLRILASSVAVLIAVAIVIGSVACLMIFKAWCRNHLGGPYATLVAVAMLNLVIIIILGEIWCRLAEWLTDKENHKYTDAYEDSLIIKRYLFDFANMYATLFYYAFFKAPFGGKIFKHRPDLQDVCLYDACITELTVQLAVVFIGKQFLNGLFEMVFPWIKRTWNRKKILADQALRREYLTRHKITRAPQWVKDDDLPSYEGRILKCYRKTVIQFGFCTLFVTSFPVAPAFALINNWIDIRMEAYRLLTQYRRPIAFRAQDIGMWEKIMEFISFTSVITNASIIAFSSLWIKQNLFVKYLHATQGGELLAARLGFILVFEHVVFLFKIILRAAIPNVPLTIKLAVQRSKYMTQVATGGRGSGADDDLDVDSLTGTDESEEDGYSGEEEVDFDSSHGHHGSAGASQDGHIHRNHPPRAKRKKGWSKFNIRRLWRRSRKKSQVHQSKFSSDPPRSFHSAHIQSHGSLPSIPEGPAVARTSKTPDSIEMAANDEKYSGTGVSSGQGWSYPSVPALHIDRRHLQISPSQRRPTPRRAQTDMDGDWVVLDESRM